MMNGAWLFFIMVLSWINLLVPTPFSYEILKQQTGGDVSSETHALFPRAATAEIPHRKDVGHEFSKESISAKSFVVMDKETGHILTSYQPDAVRSAASITKLMAAIVFLERGKRNGIDWQKKLTVTRNDQRNGIAFVYRNDLLTLYDAFHASLVGSVNSLVNVFVRAVSDDAAQFIDEMNAQARQYGLWNTHFTDVTGLSKENVTSAKEVAWLLKEALTYPEIKESLLTPVYEFETLNTHRQVVVSNTNKLLGRGLHIEGGKTGYIIESQYNFAVDMANKVGNEIIVVVLGSESEEGRFDDAVKLAQWTFANYEWR